MNSCLISKIQQLKFFAEMIIKSYVISILIHFVSVRGLPENNLNIVVLWIEL